ncbi:hypothetical protein Vadar_030663 [Vaccinium darrowii]|uniref:Uncharacterized protein n=1 Tax=Vaccinium darrowii TaxID=229202 RepID=A0ACB7ZF50_9ERIC|nr:hypothetical protein Vadar_030663 [Vaccinium darrowii]
MGPSKCKICNEAQIKYKCSTCLTPYCSSSACLKKHKDTWRHRGGQESVPNVGVKVYTALDNWKRWAAAIAIGVCSIF